MTEEEAYAVRVERRLKETERALGEAKNCLRDQFAAAALTGLLSCDRTDTIRNNAEYASLSYGLADAMLAERTRRG